MTERWTDVGRHLGADRLDRADQHDRRAQQRVASGPGQRPGHVRRRRRLAQARRVARRQLRPVDALQLGDDRRHRHAPASDRRGRRSGQPRRAHRRDQDRQHASRRHHGDAPRRAGTTPRSTSRSTAPTPTPASPSVEWQLNADPIVTGVTPGDSVRIGTQGQHDFKTRIVDNAGNLSAWNDHDVWVDIAGPSDTTVVPSDWLTTPSTVVNVTAEADGASITRLQWRLDGNTTGQVLNADTVPVTVSGDGVHELEVRVTDSLGRILDWQSHHVKIDTRQPDRHDGRRHRLAALRHAQRHRSRHRRPLRDRSASSGGSTAATSSPSLGSSHDVVVTGQGAHTLETRVVDNAGLASAWKPRTIKLDTTAARRTPRRSPRRAGATRRTRSCSTARTRGSGVASVGWKLRSKATLESAEHLGAKGVETATISADGTHTLNTRVHDLAGNASGYRTETIKIDTVAPTDGTVYPSAPVGNRHVITFAGHDARSGVAGSRVEARRRRRADRRPGEHRRRRPAHAVGAREGQRRQLERLGRPRDHGRPRRSTPPPRPTRPSSRPSGAPARTRSP